MNGAIDTEDEARRVLLERVVAEVWETGMLTGCYELSAPVARALVTVPRHLFVPPGQRPWAYTDTALGIGCGQTISQPFIVALMTELLALCPEDEVLEIGTGSGYQTAVLAHLARRVYSMERIPELAAVAVQRLQALGLDNVEIRIGDGAQGWSGAGAAVDRFDRVMVTAAAAEVPEALLRQLKPGGRLVVPVGLPHRTQDLRLLCKDACGRIESRSVLPVVFVPLVEERAA